MVGHSASSIGISVAVFVLKNCTNGLMARAHAQNAICLTKTVAIIRSCCAVNVGGQLAKNYCFGLPSWRAIMNAGYITHV